MKINIRLSAGLAYAAGQTRLALTLEECASVGDAIGALTAQQPTLQGRLARAPLDRLQQLGLGPFIRDQYGIG